MDRISVHGFVAAAAAYVLWGVSPLYFALVRVVPAAEILSHRIVWSVLCLLPLSLLLSGRKKLRAHLTDRKVLGPTAIASLLVSCNWITFIYAVSSGRTLEASLGYFLNPIFIVLLGRYFFKEKLNVYQLVCLILASLALLYQLIQGGKLSWISLTLALSFGLYGLVKKKVTAPAWDGMLFETVCALPFAGLYFLYLWYRGQLATTTVDTETLVYLSLAGVVTATPLVLFAYGAQRLPLVTVGFLQYIAPSLQMTVAIVYLGERLSTDRLIAFTMIWLGLVVMVFGNIQTRRRRLRRH